MANQNQTKKVPSTQQHINIAEIRNGVVVTKTGLLRKIVAVLPVNFALKSEEEKNVIVGQYQNFLNSLNFPLQIILHSRRLDVAPYIGSLEKKIFQEPNELLRYHALEYVDFIRRLNQLTNIMDKKFYVVVGFDPPNLSQTGLLGRIFGRKEQNQINFTTKDWEKYTSQLEERLSIIVSGLSAMSLKAEPLDTQKAIELFYGIYNPEEAVTEKLIDSAKLQAPVIGQEKKQIDEAVLKPENFSSSPTLPTPVENKANGLNPNQKTNAEQKIASPSNYKTKTEK